MAGQMKNAAVIGAVTMMMMVGMASAATYTVGDSTGWIVPPSKTLYSTWASRQSIKVGDVLVFNFTTGAHTVSEVSKSDYDACTFANPLSTAANGPASITIKTAGTHYYLCTVGPHCSLGQKVAVSAASSSSSASPTASPASSPSATTPSTSPAAAETPEATTPATTPSMSPSGSASMSPSGSASGPSASSPNSVSSTARLGGGGLVLFSAVLITALFH